MPQNQTEMFFLDRSQALKTRKENHPHRPRINAAQCRVSDTTWTHRTLHTNGHSTTYALGCWSSPNVYDKQKLREPWDLSKVAQLVLRNHPSRNWKCYSVFPGEVYCDEDRKPIRPLTVFPDENRYIDVTLGSLNQNINISLSHLIKITFPCYGLIICKLHTNSAGSDKLLQ